MPSNNNSPVAFTLIYFTIFAHMLQGVFAEFIDKQARLLYTELNAKDICRMNGTKNAAHEY
jgi:hypothetical protein